MDFKYIILAIDAKKEENGFSCSDAGGGWDLYKCFYQNDDEYGEFYLNLNTQSHEGEIKMKDEKYGRTLIDALEKEFLPETLKGSNFIAPQELEKQNSIEETAKEIVEEMKEWVNRDASSLDSQSAVRAVEKILEKPKNLIDWNEFDYVLQKLEKNKDKTISRHAKGLLKALRLIKTLRIMRCKICKKTIKENTDRDRYCIKCGKTSGLLEEEDICYTCAKERKRL